MIEINAAYEAIQKINPPTQKPTERPFRPQYEPYSNHQRYAYKNAQSTHKKRQHYYDIYYVNYQNGQRIPTYFWITLLFAMGWVYFGMIMQSNNARALLAREQKLKELKKRKEQAEHE